MPDRHRYKVTSIRLEPREKARYQYIAESQGKTLTQLIREALQAHLQQLESQQDKNNAT